MSDQTNFQTADIFLHGIDYIIKIIIQDGLTIKLEQKNNGDQWKNHFTENYIEQITAKTGNHKKFDVFVKMLLSSIQKKSDSVYLDILTFQDLELMKNRRNESTTQSQVNLAKNNKRYCILSYVVEFDKVHYPLPLNFEENPDQESLKATILRLNIELEQYRNSNQVGTSQSFNSSNNLLTKLTRDNELLQEKVRSLESNGQQRYGAVEFDLIARRKIELENELEQIKQKNQIDTERYSQQIEKLEQDLFEKKNEIIHLRNESQVQNPSQKSQQNIKINEQTEQELFNCRKIMAKQIKTIESQSQEIENMQLNDKKQKNRIRQLEMDLEQSLKKVSIKKVSDRLYSNNNSRGNSPSNSYRNSPRQQYSPANSIKGGANNKFVSPSASNRNNSGPKQYNNYLNKNNKYSNVSSRINSNVSSRNSSPGASLTKKPSSTINNGRLSPAQNSSKNTTANRNQTNFIGQNRNKIQNQRASPQNQRPSPQNQRPSPSNQRVSPSNIQQNKSRTSPQPRQQNTNLYGNQKRTTDQQNRFSPRNAAAPFKDNNLQKQNNQAKISVSPSQRMYSGMNNRPNQQGGVKKTIGQQKQQTFNSEEQRLIQKLDELKNKNKENSNNQVSGGEVQNKAMDLETEDIDARLNKLQNLLKIAKN